jgi:hypothetical protein
MQARRLTTVQQPVTTLSRDEEKHANFRRLAVSRMGKALDALANIAQLGNRETYVFTDEETAKIVRVLRENVDAIEDSFQRGQKIVTFRFDDC